MKKRVVTTVFAFLCKETAADVVKTAKIDRYALVGRHNVSLADFNPLASLSVGNDRFTFTSDLTGPQSFPRLYEKGSS